MGSSTCYHQFKPSISRRLEKIGDPRIIFAFYCHLPSSFTPFYCSRKHLESSLKGVIYSNLLRAHNAGSCRWRLGQVGMGKGRRSHTSSLITTYLNFDSTITAPRGFRAASRALCAQKQTWLPPAYFTCVCSHIACCLELSVRLSMGLDAAASLDNVEMFVARM